MLCVLVLFCFVLPGFLGFNLYDTNQLSNSAALTFLCADPLKSRDSHSSIDHCASRRVVVNQMSCTVCALQHLLALLIMGLHLLLAAGISATFII